MDFFVFQDLQAHIVFIIDNKTRIPSRVLEKTPLVDFFMIKNSNRGCHYKPTCDVSVTSGMWHLDNYMDKHYTADYF